MMYICIFLSVILLSHADSSATTTSALQQGLQYHRQGDFNAALLKYQSIITNDPTSCSDCFHLTGIIQHRQSNFEQAIVSIQAAIRLAPLVDNYYNTLGEVFRQIGQPHQAAEHFRKAIRLSSTPNVEHYNSLGLVQMELGDSTKAATQFQRVLSIEPHHPAAAHNLGLAFRNMRDFENSIRVLQSLRERKPDDSDAVFHLAISLQMSGKLHEAGLLYKNILNAPSSLEDPDRLSAIQVNLGAIHQESGNFLAAIDLYNQVLEKKPNDSRALNNLGSSLWQLGYAERSVAAYRRAIKHDAASPEPYVNLGVALYEYGDVTGAEEMYDQALSLGGANGLLVRKAMLMKPIMISNHGVQNTRDNFFSSVQRLLNMSPKLTIDEPVKDIERLHFYLVYHGFNEYQNQVIMARLYLSSSPHLRWVSPWLVQSVQNENEDDDTPRTKIRVGFISKFFVVNHAHGQLLEGIVAHLPRERFEIVICAIPNPQQTLLPSMTETAEHVHHLSFNLREARIQMSELRLDVLIFADMMSEPLTYFLGLGSRIAPVQCLFWGNPVTSGGRNIDYFISGEHMEPERSNAESDIEQYSEQVLLLQGQGIWYDQVPVPTLLTTQEQEAEDVSNHWKWRQDDPSAVVYLCPQSSFKLHPDFDVALARILRAVPHGHLVLLKGRRETWTKMVQDRMRAAMPDVWHRVHFVPRVAGSDAFMRLLQRADIMLHPFPFGGSKTSADALAAGIPLVCLVTNSLRGRMAYSYFVTMDMYDTVARTVEEYVRIAARLGHDKIWRLIVSRAVREKSPLIWERMSVVDAWANFLDRAHRTQIVNQQQQQQQPLTRLSNANNDIPTTSTNASSNVVSSPDASINQLLHNARSFYELGDVTNAQYEYERVLKIRPNDPGILNDFGAVLKQSNQLALAKEMFGRATRAQPGYIVAHNNLGVVLQEMGLFQEASREYIKVLDIDATHPNAVYNLGNLYRDIGRDDKAMELLQRTLRLEYNSADIVCLFSLLDVDGMQAMSRNALQESLLVNTSMSVDIMSAEVHRLQTSYLDATNSLVKFMTQLRHPEMLTLSRQLIGQVRHFMLNTPQQVTLQSSNEFHVIVQWYQASTSTRQAEINECLQRNLASEEITRVHVLTEENTLFSSTTFENLDKLVQTVVGDRLTFARAFEYARDHLYGQICSVANADIYYDDISIKTLLQRRKRNTVYATLRWEEEKNHLPFRIDSQDTWTFQSPLKVNDVDFEIGRLRSDNRIAAQLLDVGYRVINNPFLFKTYHVQATEKRPGRTNREQIPGKIAHLLMSTGY